MGFRNTHLYTFLRLNTLLRLIDCKQKFPQAMSNQIEQLQTKKEENLGSTDRLDT